MKEAKIELYATIAKTLAKSSTCDRANVGALLLKEGRIVATGYNGSLPKQVHCNNFEHLMEDGHCIRTIHAEQNILLFCAKVGVATQDTTLFVTHKPCNICTKMLIQAGVKTVYYLEEYGGTNHFEKLTEMKQIQVGGKI